MEKASGRVFSLDVSRHSLPNGKASPPRRCCHDSSYHTVTTNISFQDALEDLTAMILAADPRDRNAVAHLEGGFGAILDTLPPSSRAAELLSLGLSGLRNIERLEGPTVLGVVASAIAALSEHPAGQDPEDFAALETAAAGLRELLPEQDLPLTRGEPWAAFAEPPEANDSDGSDRDAGAFALACGGDAELLKDFVIESRDRVAAAEAAILLLETNPEDTESINRVLRAFHTIKGAAGLLGISRIQTLAHQAENLLIRGRDGEIRMVGRPIDLALQSCDMLKFMIDSLENRTPGQEPAIPKNLDTLLEALSEHDPSADSTRRGKYSAGRSVEAVEVSEPSAESSDASSLQSVRQGDTDASVRVTTERLDDLVNMVGELVIAQSILTQDSQRVEDESGRLRRSVSRAGKIVRQMQDLAISLRMIPMKGTFGKMARLVRDLSHKSGKTVQFRTEGEETEIDRNLVEILNDPLVHMIRNAVDHGIEPASQRAAEGKNPTGTLNLRAYHAAGSVVIELEDDGRGLRCDKILDEAIRRGLVERNGRLPDDELHSLIFHPGLSTADNVTDLSGRGVGLDVVKRNVEAVRGRIEVATAPGEGTKFTLRLPLTMAIIDAMLVRVGAQQYLLPTIAIRRSFRPDPGALSSVTGRGEIVELQGQLHPLFRLHELFRVEGAVANPCEAIVIVIEGAGKRCALMVDAIVGQQQAVIKSLGAAMSDVPGVAGGAILGDGRIGLILDAAGLVQLAHGRAGPLRRVPSPEPPRATEPST